MCIARKSIHRPRCTNTGLIPPIFVALGTRGPFLLRSDRHLRCTLEGPSLIRISIKKNRQIDFNIHLLRIHRGTHPWPQPLPRKFRCSTTLPKAKHLINSLTLSQQCRFPMFIVCHPEKTMPPHPMDDLRTPQSREKGTLAIITTILSSFAHSELWIIPAPWPDHGWV